MGPHDNLATAQRSLRRSCSPLFLLLLALLASPRCVESGEPSPSEARPATSAPGARPIATQAAADWVQDALVVAMPAAAVGGCQAGIYTPAVNGVQPWRQAIIRWLTSRHVMGNTAILVRQEAAEGGAGLSAVVDPNAEYRFQVNVMLPGIGFGERPKEDPPLWITVLDCSDRVIAESPARLAPGKWSTSQVVFHSGPVREVRCVVRGKSPP